MPLLKCRAHVYARICGIFILFTGFARPETHVHGNLAQTNKPELCDSLLRYARSFLNRPYCYGSKPPRCFDCSGFVNHVFSEFGTGLPASSGTIAFKGKFVSFANAQPADLVFFTGSNRHSETVGHVGIVTACRSDTIFFIHASVQAGVIESHSKESYYASRILFVKRIRLIGKD